jgi:hypothetical protein
VSQKTTSSDAGLGEQRLLKVQADVTFLSRDVNHFAAGERIGDDFAGSHDVAPQVVGQVAVADGAPLIGAHDWDPIFWPHFRILTGMPLLWTAACRHG